VARIQIKGGEFPIEKIFSNDFVFHIPLYQRPYAWEREEAEELLDDLLGFLGAGTEKIEDLSPYFLGSIVVIKEDFKPEAEVVDGQQRLTTLTILLSAIRSRLAGEQNKAQVKFAEALTDYLYEKGSPVSQTQDRFRLSLKEKDNEFFRDYIQREGEIEKLRAMGASKLNDSQKNISQNAITLLDRLKKESTATCTRLAQFTIKQCFLVVVSTPDFASAYRTFMVLNNRGRDLSHSDILKAQIIGEIPETDRPEYGKRWEKSEELLGREAFKDLFSHIRAIYQQNKLKGTVLDEFRKSVMKEVTDKKKLVDEVIKPFAESYADIKEADYENTTGAAEVNQLLKWLDRIDHADWLPPAILFMTKQRNKPTALKDFFKDLERLATSLMLLRATVNERIARYGRVMEAINKNEDLYQTNSPLQLTSTEKAEAIKVLDGDVYNLLPKVRTYILLRLDTELAAPGVAHQYDLITVEHVLPQNPGSKSEWERWFPDPKVREDVVHRLGNLALLNRKKNSSASNQ